MTDKSYQCVIVGIVGASAPGKSLCVSPPYRAVRERAGDENVGVISGYAHDKDQRHLPMAERAKTHDDHSSAIDSVIVQYQKTARPTCLQFIEPSRQYADIMVPRGGKNRIAIDILKAKINQFF